MSVSDTLQAMRTGFSKNFWIANTLELFERFAYYGSKAVLTVYVAEAVGLGPESAGWLVGSVFNTLLYFLPILAGTVVDRYGFKTSLSICFTVFSLGYLLIGLAGLPAGQPMVEMLGARNYMLVALMITAAGGSLIKPSIVGTVARTTTAETKSLGYSVYYMLVNIGGAIGPLLAVPVRENLGIAYVLVMSSVVSLVLLLATLLFFREPPRPAEAPAAKSMGLVLGDMVKVFGDLRFMAFLVIFSGFWIMFWQIFYSLPVLRARRAEVPAVRDHRNGRCVDHHPRHRAGHCAGQEAVTDSRDDPRVRAREPVVVRDGDVAGGDRGHHRRDRAVCRGRGDAGAALLRVRR